MTLPAKMTLEKISFSSARPSFTFFIQLKIFLPAVYTIQLDHDHARALLSIEKISFSPDLYWSQFRYSVKTFFLLQILPIQLFLGTQTAL